MEHDAIINCLIAASMKVPARRRGNTPITDPHNPNPTAASMKVPARRRGNTWMTTVQASCSRCLNESPRPKAGK